MIKNINEYVKNSFDDDHDDDDDDDRTSFSNIRNINVNVCIVYTFAEYYNIDELVYYNFGLEYNVWRQSKFGY